MTHPEGQRPPRQASAARAQPGAGAGRALGASTAQDQLDTARLGAARAGARRGRRGAARRRGGDRTFSGSSGQASRGSTQNQGPPVPSLQARRGSGSVSWGAREAAAAGAAAGLGPGWAHSTQHTARRAQRSWWVTRWGDARLGGWAAGTASPPLPLLPTRAWVAPSQATPCPAAHLSMLPAWLHSPQWSPRVASHTKPLERSS
jgi:hypothetical protein